MERFNYHICLTFRVVLHPPDKAACVFQQTISPSIIAEKSISLFGQFELKVRVRVISFQFLILKLFYYLDNLNLLFSRYNHSLEPTKVFNWDLNVSKCQNNVKSVLARVFRKHKKKLKKKHFHG